MNTMVKRGGFGWTAELLALRKVIAALPHPARRTFARAGYTDWYCALPPVAMAYLKRRRPPAS